METLYSNPVYMEHLKRRGMKQTIMLGFSDGTKDGGYLMANWGIFKATYSLTAVEDHRLEEEGTPINFMHLSDQR